MSFALSAFVSIAVAAATMAVALLAARRGGPVAILVAFIGAAVVVVHGLYVDYDADDPAAV